MDPNSKQKLSKLATLLPLLAIWLLSGCGDGAWNNPYPKADKGHNILYSSFTERPKHLDPVRAYSANEYAFIAQIYEPLLQYHFLKRPYELIPLGAEQVPSPVFLDADGNKLPEDADAERIAFSEYEISIKPGMRYQPHPALARDDVGNYLYHQLDPEFIETVNTLSDFPKTGTREVTAADYVYQIKRLAYPRLNSPIAGVMGEYILGFPEYGEETSAAYGKLEDSEGNDDLWLDLRSFDLEGVEVLDTYRFRVRLRGKYPQFVYWLAMPFFSPMPWEAEAFYSQPGLEKRNISLHWYPLGSGPFMLEENKPNFILEPWCPHSKEEHSACHGLVIAISSVPDNIVPFGWQMLI